MALTLIANLDPGLQCRNTLNAVIDLVGANHPWTAGSIPYTNSSNDYAQDNANFFWDDAAKLLTSGAGINIKGATSGVVTVNAKAVAGAWTLTLPDTAGTNTYVLTTNGSGVTSWTAPGGGGGGMAIGGAITGGTAGRVLFAGASGVLDDDSTFTWNDTLKDLAIGGAYYVNAARALYVVPNVTENNWFEGNAGNQTVTGYGNFGTGDLALSSVTTGYDNAAIGTRAMRKVTTGANNFAFGSYALAETLTDVNNLAIGYGTMQYVGLAGAGGGNNFNNVAIGYAALGQLIQGYNNVVMGWGAVSNITGSTVAISNTIMGANAGGHLGVAGGATVRDNTLLGASAALNLTGGIRNVWIGGYGGPAAVVDNTIALSSGTAVYLLDCNLTSAHTWSFNMAANTEACGFHIYRMQNTDFSISNHERVSLDFDADYFGAASFWIHSQAAGSGVKRLIAIDGWAKAGAPAAADLPSGSYAVIDDTAAGATWLVFNKGGTIRKVQLV